MFRNETSDIANGNPRTRIVHNFARTRRPTFELADQTTHKADLDFFSLSTDEENIQPPVVTSKRGANTQFCSAHRTTLDFADKRAVAK